ncbi:MAG: M23 family metallopeptidase [Acidobacteria bacterium]|nr:M23 family metallopeptidase [Acidobacteriota bacterium]
MRRRLLVGLVAAVIGAWFGPLGIPAASASVSSEVVFRKIVTPVQGPIHYSNDFGAALSGHLHQGNDLMGHKLEVEVAAHDGVVGWTSTDGNNMLELTDSDGWSYVYIHINNDTPGTDDGANPPEWMFFPGIEEGVAVTAGQPIAYMGDSGNAETTSPHLHFEIHKPDGTAVDPYWSLMLSQGRRVLDRCSFDTNPDREPSTEAGGGYWAATADGGVFSYGAAVFHGSMGGVKLASPVIALVPTPTGGGYWELSRDGGVFSFGDAAFFGSTGGKKLAAPVVGMAPTPTGRGYWLVAADGGVFSFGDAVFFGSTGGQRLNRPINGMAASPTGQGYWLQSSDGGVFSFGDALFHGRAAGSATAAVLDLVPTPTGQGYWQLSSNGAIHGFGDAAWEGGANALGYCSPPTAVAMSATSTGRGYWIQTADGNTFPFGDAKDFGSVKRQGLAGKPIVSMAALPGPAAPADPSSVVLPG